MAIVSPSPFCPDVVPELRLVLGCVVSSDFPLPRLRAAATTQMPRVTIRGSGHSTSLAKTPEESNRFTRTVTGEGITYTAYGIGEFRIHDGGARITYSLAPDAPLGDVQHVLTGPALVMALQLQGEFFLHAAAFERDGAMFGLSAPHGFGKSTLAASLLDAGCVVHSDDVVPLRELDGTIVGRQGQPWIKLWDNVLGEFGQDANDYDEVLDGLGKRVVPAITSSQEEVPLRGIFLLAPHMDETKPIAVAPLERLNAALAVMSNVHSPEIMTGALAAITLGFATRIAEKVPVRIISYYRSFENLPAIREAILQDVEGLMHA